MSLKTLLCCCYVVIIISSWFAKYFLHFARYYPCLASLRLLRLLSGILLIAQGEWLLIASEKNCFTGRATRRCVHAEFGAIDFPWIVQDCFESPYGNRRTRWLSSHWVPRAEGLATSLDSFGHYLYLEKSWLAGTMNASCEEFRRNARTVVETMAARTITITIKIVTTIIPRTLRASERKVRTRRGARAIAVSRIELRWLAGKTEVLQFVQVTSSKASIWMKPARPQKVTIYVKLVWIRPPTSTRSNRSSQSKRSMQVRTRFRRYPFAKDTPNRSPIQERIHRIGKIPSIPWVSRSERIRRVLSRERQNARNRKCLTAVGAGW